LLIDEDGKLRHSRMNTFGVVVVADISIILKLEVRFSYGFSASL
jgi:hypothetical protein